MFNIHNKTYTLEIQKNIILTLIILLTLKVFSFKLLQV